MDRWINEEINEEMNGRMNMIIKRIWYGKRIKTRGGMRQ